MKACSRTILTLTASGLSAWKQTLSAVKGIHLTEDEELKWASLWSSVVRPGVEDKAQIGPALPRKP